jgi:hypothetical protein
MAGRPISSTVSRGVRGDDRGRHRHGRVTCTGRIAHEHGQRDLVRDTRFGAIEHVDLMREDGRPIRVDVLHETRPKRLITNGMQCDVRTLVHLISTSRRAGHGSHGNEAQGKSCHQGGSYG